jgi:hypothetical protein
VTAFLENENVECLEWPASPDMNPIEPLWAEISRMLGNMDNPTLRTIVEPALKYFILMKHNTEYQVAYKRGKLSNHLKKCYFDFV